MPEKQHRVGSQGSRPRGPVAKAPVGLQAENLVAPTRGRIARAPMRPQTESLLALTRGRIAKTPVRPQAEILGGITTGSIARAPMSSTQPRARETGEVGNRVGAVPVRPQGKR